MKRLVTALRTIADLARGPDRRHRSLGQLAAYGKRVRLRVARDLLRRRQPLVAIALCEHMGDLVAAEPVARAVRDRHPDARIVWVSRRAYVGLLQGHPALDGVLVVRCLTEWIYLRRSRAFAAIYDLHLPGRSCAVCCLPDRRVATDPAIDVDSYYRHGDLLAAFCRTAGLPVLDESPRLPLPSPAARRRVDALRLPAVFVAFHCRSQQASRDWNDAGWRQLTDQVAGSGVPIVEVGTVSVLGERAIDLCGKLPIAATAEVIRRARAFVGIDSGPAHLAHAARTPGVVLLGDYRGFGAYMPYAGRWRRGDGVRLVRADGPLRELTVDEVAPAVTAALGEALAPPQVTVSVVVPTYGHARLVQATLDSVFAQTFTDFEVIVVDDGSPDDTAERLLPLRRAGKIRWLEQPNAGQAAARNTGLAAARGEFVAFLDDDDLWPSDKLAWQVAALRARPDAVMVFGRHVVLEADGVDDGNGGNEGNCGSDGTGRDAAAGGTDPRATPDAGRRDDEHEFAGDVRRAFRLCNRLQSPGQTLVRADALRSVGGFDPTLWGSDDWDLWLRLAERGDFVFEPRVALHYRRHADNSSRDAVRHAHNHLRVVRRHLGFDLPLVLRHQRRAAAFFVGNLLRQARAASAAERPELALRACGYALLFRLRLLLQPWFVAECTRLLLRIAATPFQRGPRRIRTSP